MVHFLAARCQQSLSMTKQLFLHYMNINTEERFPHTLEFGFIDGKIVTDHFRECQVITLVAVGMPRRYYVWSTFIANQEGLNKSGKRTLSGPGWHLCPPQEVSEKNVNFLTDKRLNDHLFIEIVDPRIAAWLLRKTTRFRPPGVPQQLLAFLKFIYRSIHDEKLEAKLEAAIKTIQLRRPTEERWNKR